MKISGIVTTGLGIAKEMGFPTLNIDAKKIPQELWYGIYAVRVKTIHGIFNGVSHFGPRPFHQAGVAFEVHCFGLNEDLYGTEVEVEVVEKIREIKNFENETELKNAIQSDIAKAKEIL